VHIIIRIPNVGSAMAHLHRWLLGAA